ncbi:MAG: DNA mismatch repair protein MutS [Oscillospiraceae bacterium]|jgi:DNA mismatch repair protein MutS
MAFPKDVENLSPMMRQYLKVKSRNMDKILMYRIGDFYEMFYDDAVTASKELDLVLTGKDCGTEERAPMCGIPFHACDQYISKLVSRGYKVAICEQLEDPAKAKGIVKRGIIRVVTPGTITESSMLDDESNNFIASVYMDRDGIGFSYADISTGSAFATEVDSMDTLISEIARISPSEIVLNEQADDDRDLRKFLSGMPKVTVDALHDDKFSTDRAEELTNKCFGEGKAPSGHPLRALGAMLSYISDTQFDGISRMTSLEIYSCRRFVSIAPQSRKNLDLFQNSRTMEKKGSLIWVMDRTCTAMGGRLLRSWIEKPLMDPAEIDMRLDAVEEFYSDTVRLSKTREILKGIPDLERLLTRVIYRSCTPRDLLALADASDRLAELRAMIPGIGSQLIKNAAEGLDDFSDLASKIRDTIAEDPPATVREAGYIRSGFSSEVDELRDMVHSSRSYLAKLEAGYKESTGIKNLKIGYNKVFGYYIEVSRGQLGMVPESFIRKQTLTTGERFITDELKDLESRILGAGERLNQLEREIYEQLCSDLAGQIDRIQNAASFAALLDVVCSNAYIARENGYARPEVDSGDRIEIRDGRHPVVEQVMNGGIYVPNDALLDSGENLLGIITGPNMAGKSTFMRGTALIVLMAQTGSFVPASYAHIGVVDAIFTRIGAADDLFMGDSTFMVEMKEVAYILKKATPRSLIILDEIGRGTSTYDGISIAKAVIDTICREGGVHARTMFATHYHEVTDMEADYSCVKNYNIAVRRRGDDIVFLRKIVRGRADDSYGIEVAKLAGLPDGTVEKAKEYLREAEAEGMAESRGRVPDLRAYDEARNSRVAQDIVEQLKEIDVNVLTPIESMTELNDLVKLARSEEDAR